MVARRTQPCRDLNGNPQASPDPTAYRKRPGGGSAARCQETGTVVERTLYFIDPLTGDTQGTMLHPRAQSNRENCTWHNFNAIPTKAGYYATPPSSTRPPRS